MRDPSIEKAKSLLPFPFLPMRHFSTSSLKSLVQGTETPKEWNMVYAVFPSTARNVPTFQFFQRSFLPTANTWQLKKKFQKLWNAPFACDLHSYTSVPSGLGVIYRNAAKKRANAALQVTSWHDSLVSFNISVSLLQNCPLATLREKTV